MMHMILYFTYMGYNMAGYMSEGEEREEIEKYSSWDEVVLLVIGIALTILSALP